MMPEDQEALGGVTAWLGDRVPASWSSAPPRITVDDEEILVVGDLDDATDPGAFREETRPLRMELAGEAQALFGRRVSWGVGAGGADLLFTTLSTPAMTRLRQRERMVLDTLVAAGVARSRSDALAWCVRLVGLHEGDWLQELRDALVHVDRVRAEGPVPA